MDYCWIVLSFPTGDLRDAEAFGSDCLAQQLLQEQFAFLALFLVEANSSGTQTVPLIVLGSQRLVMSSSLENGVSSKCKLHETDTWHPLTVWFFPECFKEGSFLRHCAVPSPALCAAHKVCCPAAKSHEGFRISGSLLSGRSRSICRR